MNEIYIYKKLNYRKVIRSANILFNNKHSFLFDKTVIANKDDTYTVSINKNSIRICYWDEHSKKGRKEINTIQEFLLRNFCGDTIYILKKGDCSILSNLKNINIIQFAWGTNDEYIKRD